MRRRTKTERLLREAIDKDRPDWIIHEQERIGPGGRGARFLDLEIEGDPNNGKGGVIVEIDGTIHERWEQFESDTLRDADHMMRGILTIRIPDLLVWHYPQAAVERIAELRAAWMAHELGRDDDEREEIQRVERRRNLIS